MTQQRRSATVWADGCLASRRAGTRTVIGCRPCLEFRDAYLDCVVYLYASEADANQGGRTGGSGFIVGVPATGLFNVWFMYIVTNRHVVENGNSVVRMKTIDNQNSIIDIDERAWVYHPAGDDIAVCFLQFDRTACINIILYHPMGLLHYK